VRARFTYRFEWVTRNAISGCENRIGRAPAFRGCWKHTGLSAARPRIGQNGATTAIGRVDIEPGQSIVRLMIRNRLRRRASAKAAGTPARAATAGAAATAASAAATAGATATASSAAGAAAAAAAATTATPRHLLHGATAVFLVEEVERREADVGDFFFTESDALCRREVQLLRDVSGGNG
jgi:hypothetical protein